MTCQWRFLMPGPLSIAPAGALTLPPTMTATTGLIAGGVAVKGLGLAWLWTADTATTTARSVMDITYQELLKKRLAHCKQTQDLNPKGAMKLIDPEW